MLNYDTINIRSFQELRTFARDHGAVDFARMVTAACSCLIADDPASHRHRWAVDRVQGALDQIGAGWPATDAAKLDVVRTTRTTPSELIDVDLAEALAALASAHGHLAFHHLVVAAQPSERGPGEGWAIERVNGAIDAISSAEERAIFRSMSISQLEFSLAVISSIDPSRPDGAIPRGGIAV